jgi:hypothetical protein
MIHESELTFVRMRLFQRWEFANFGTKGLLFSRDFANDGKKTEVYCGNLSDRESFH